jgi:hypothetical protein
MGTSAQLMPELTASSFAQNQTHRKQSDHPKSVHASPAPLMDTLLAVPMHTPTHILAITGQNPRQHSTSLGQMVKETVSCTGITLGPTTTP